MILKMKEKKLRIFSIVLSTIFHLLIFFIIIISKKNSPIEILSKKNEKDIVMKFELIETPTPKSPQIPDASTKFVSDKTTQAQDLFKKEDLLSGTPFSSNIINNQDKKINDSQAKILENKDSKPIVQNDVTEIRDEFIEKAKFEMKHLKKNIVSINKISSENLISTAKKYGSIQFNTYEWDFAPYMLAMKKKVEKNIHPPPAFTRMGMISGDILVRFKVKLNGEIEDLEVLEYNSHISLVQTSVSALTSSAPFLPLPKKFPKKYLEVTALFTFSVRK